MSHQLQTEQLHYADGTEVNILTTDRSSVPYIELWPDGYSEVRRQDAIESKRMVACRFADVDDLISDFLGTSLFQPGNMVGGQTTNISRFPPEQHPYLDYLWASECELVNGMGVPPDDESDLAKSLSSSVDFETADTTDPGTFAASFNLAKIAVTYRAVQWDVFNDADTPASPALGELGRYVYKVQQFSSSNLPLPGNAFKFVNDGQPAPTNIVRNFPRINAVYLWKQVPKINSAEFSTAIGKVNAPGDANGYPTNFDNFYPPGTLLCTAINTQRTQTAAGDVCFDITFNFSYQPTGWNSFFHKTGTNAYSFIEVSVDGTPYPEPAPAGVHVFDSTDFHKLFELPSS